MNLKKIVPFALFAALLCGAATCVEYSTYCGKKIDCEGGNDKDKAACADEAEGSEDSAGDYGCSKEFDDYATCLQEKAACTNSKYGTADCNGQGTTLSTCIKGATGKK